MLIDWSTKHERCDCVWPLLFDIIVVQCRCLAGPPLRIERWSCLMAMSELVPIKGSLVLGLEFTYVHTTQTTRRLENCNDDGYPFLGLDWNIRWICIHRYNLKNRLVLCHSLLRQMCSLTVLMNCLKFRLRAISCPTGSGAAEFDGQPYDRPRPFVLT